MSTYTAEADHLTREYDRAVGYALQYGIKTFVPGTGRADGRPSDFGPWGKALGDLRTEIREHERAHNITDGLFPSRPTSATGALSGSGMSPAYCSNGHEFRMWGGPLMGHTGDSARLWGSPCVCSCGAAVRFGRR